MLLTTKTDILVGTSGNDTFSGADSTTAAADTYSDADRIIDAQTTDDDTYNLSVNATSTPDVTNVENVKITMATTAAAQAVNAASISGAKVLTVTPGNVSVGGASIVGVKTVAVTNLNAAKVPEVVVGAGATTASVTQKTAAGAIINADAASADVTVVGAATVKAAGAGANDTVTVTAGDTDAGGNFENLATENAKAVVVTTGAQTVTIANDANGATADAFTGTINVTANAAATINIANATGGVTVEAKKTSATINVNNIDDSGATITAGEGVKADDLNINLDGTGGTLDVATVSAAGKFVTLDADTTDLVETLNLSGNGAAVTYTMASSVPTKYVLTGDQSVTVSQAIDNLNGVTVTDSTTAGTTTVAVTGTLGADRDLSKIGADVISIAADIGSTAAGSQAIFASGANIQLAKDQAELALEGKSTGATLNIAVADDTAADGSTIEITTGAAKLSVNVTTVNLDATVGKFTATGTTLAATGVLNITASKTVDLGTMTGGKTIAAAAATGAIKLNTGAANTTLKSITTGSGDDVVTTDTDAVYAVDLGDGDNTLTIAASGADPTSSFNMGVGADIVSLQDASAVVIVTGAGDDTVTIGASGAGIDSDAIIVLGDGTADKVVFAEDSDTDGNSNFAMIGVEIVEIGADADAVTMTAAAFAQDNTFKLLGASAATDTLTITNTGTSGATIDASNITFETTQEATLVLVGKAKLADTITGSAKNDSITMTSGGDTISGGSGTDTLTLDTTTMVAATVEGSGTGTSTGVVINLGTTAVTNTSVLAYTGNYTATTVTSVEAGKVAYVFAGSVATNSAVLGTVSGIENVVGTDGNDFIVGSSSANTITGGLGRDGLTGGAAADTFVIGDTDSGITATTADSILDFVSGTDKLKLGTAGDATANTGTYVEAGAAVADFAAALTAANVALNTLFGTTTSSTEIYSFQFDGNNGYLFEDTDVDGDADQVIILVGVDNTEIAATDIIA